MEIYVDFFKKHSRRSCQNDEQVVWRAVSLFSFVQVVTRELVAKHMLTVVIE